MGSLLAPQLPVTEPAAPTNGAADETHRYRSQSAFSCVPPRVLRPVLKRMVIDDVDGECVVPGELLGASLASRRWPADADAAAHLLDSDLYV